MSHQLREVLSAVRKICPDAELVNHGRGHPRVILQTPAGERFVVVARTPSDRRSLQNVLKIVRKEMRL